MVYRSFERKNRIQEFPFRHVGCQQKDFLFRMLIEVYHQNIPILKICSPTSSHCQNR